MTCHHVTKIYSGLGISLNICSRSRSLQDTDIQVEAGIHEGPYLPPHFASPSRYAAISYIIACVNHSVFDLGVLCKRKESVLFGLLQSPSF